MKFQSEEHGRARALGAVWMFVVFSTAAAAVTPVDEAANRHTDSGATIDSSNVRQLRQTWRISSDGPPGLLPTGRTR
jgi:uncharacterized membrane protein YgcG